VTDTPPGVDLERLRPWFAAHVAGATGGELQASLISGGRSNLTYAIHDGDRDLVLRRPPLGHVLPTAHDMAREYKVLAALAPTEVPVPKTLGFCDDVSVNDAPFYVMELVTGNILRTGADIARLSHDDARRCSEELIDVLVAIHAVDYEAVGLGDFGHPDGYVERQVRRWGEQWERSKTRELPVVDELARRLRAAIPVSPPPTIVHGDYRLDNLVFHPSEPRVVAVLDWELSTLGHPLADFSYHCMSWHIPPGSFRGIGGLDHAALGIPTEKEYVRRYCERTGRSDPDALMADWNFYLAYNLFRIAGILQGIAKRVEAGTASSAQARQSAAGARPLAEMGWRIAQQS
jgi:aminoglycoside phosphotransferase (APT) family kinase protein